MKPKLHKLKHYLFAPRWHLSRIQFNLIAVIFITTGVIVGSYLTITEIILPRVFASNDTTTTWDLTSSDGFAYDTDLVGFGGSGAYPGINKLTNSTFDTDLTSWSEVPSYTLNDQFTTDRAAGEVDGTSAEPTGGTRIATDTNSKFSVTGGQASFATGGISYGNPGLWYPSLTRAMGRILVGTINLDSCQDGFMLGFDTGTSSTLDGNAFYQMNQTLVPYDSKVIGPVIMGIPFGAERKLALILRGTGAYYYAKGGTFTNWTLVWISSISSTATPYPGIIGGGYYQDTVFTADNIRIPTATWLPTPLAYDTFTRDDGAIGSSETTGPDDQTTPSLDWTGGAISSNTNVITPSLGGEMWDTGAATIDTGTYHWAGLGTNTIENDSSTLKVTYNGNSSGAQDYLRDTYDLSSDLSIDTWYGLSIDVKSDGSRSLGASVYDGTTYHSGILSASASFDTKYITYRASSTTNMRVFAPTGMGTGTIGWVDNLSLKPLTLSSLFSSVSTSDTDVIADADVTLTAGTQAGIVTNLDSTSSPANFLIAYHNGSKVYLDKNVGGTYTSLINTAKTYSEGATLRVITYHSDANTLKVRVYYNNTLVGSEQTVTDAGIISNTKHGLFSTYEGNTFDNFTLFARGTGGEYTSAPFEELTATRDTDTKYAGDASVKLVASDTDANYLQSVTLPDTETYSLVAYAYTDGSAVTTADLDLYFDDGAISTSYEDMGSGWYKLSGSLTGIASEKDYGVKVKAGVTVYVDSFSLYQNGTYALYNETAYSNAYVQSWDTFCEGTLSGSECSEDATHEGSSAIKYQLCTDDGSTCEGGSSWKYWDGDSWETAGNTTTHTNPASEITTTAMAALPIVSQQISFKAIFTLDVSNVPYLPHISVGLSADIVDPITNASVLVMTRSNGGTSMSSGDWTNNDSPYFSWTAGADDENGTGIRGYCLYVGTDSDGDPETSKGLLGTSPASLGESTCQFIVSGTSVDLATSSYKGDPWLTSSSSAYYLNIKAIDYGDNVFSGASAQFEFKYDGTDPTNASYISCASGSFSNVADMNFSWPTSGDTMASDANADLFGYQYQINSTDGTWLGSTTEAVLGVGNYIPSSETSRTLTQDQDGDSIVSGNNIVYFKAVDAAGNISDDTIRTCNLSYGGAAPSFDGLDTVTVTPASSTSNSFALSWPEATATFGQEVAGYYYMVNTSPPSTYATLTGNATTYVSNGTEVSVSATALINVNKGSNTVYVVAVDDADTPNYSPSNYISGTFTLNSTDPNNVGDLVASDSSIKAQSQWNVTLTWTAPSYQGAGNLTYLVHRSTDGTTFSQVGTTSGLSYVDNTPASALYYYKIYTQDGADATSSGTNAVTITPTGKWTSAPSLSSGPDAGSVTQKKATITWSTSRSSDSKVQYGTTSGSYSDVEPSNSSQVSSHSIQLTGLTPGTTYYYKVKWTDEDGNTGTSDEKSFATSAAPTVKDVSARNIGLTSAIIEFTSLNSSKVKIYYGTSTSFGGVKEVSTSTTETTYTSELTGLLDGTKYYYKINTFDSESEEYDNQINDFSTLPRPRISNVRLQQVTNTAQSTILVTWKTNTEISSIITYYPQGDLGGARDEVNVALTKGDHRMIVRSLLPQTDYILTVKGRDKIGNEAVSDSQRFTTATDTRPPQVSGMRIEGSAVPPTTTTAQESTAQLLASWNTDEPATSQVEFGEGTGTTYSSKTQEDGNLTNNHLVVISGLTPSKVYHVRAISKDSVGNTGNSVDTVTITPKATENALDLVITNLQKVFGFLKGI